GRAARAVATEVVLALPENFLRLQIERAEAAIGGGVVNRVPLRIAAKPAQSLFERNLDPADETMAVVDVEDEDAFARAAFLGSVGRAQVEITFQTGLGGGEQSHRNRRQK